MNTLPAYKDHIGLWKNELKAWLPDELFDAHVHLGPPGAVTELSPPRHTALTVWTSLKWEDTLSGYKKLYSGKNIAGVIAFPIPIQEVNVGRANDYIAEIMRSDRRVKGLMAVNPARVDAAVAQFHQQEKKGVRFYGCKPYFDLLGKSNYATRMEELLPEKLLRFMNSEETIMMLHTSSIGVGDPAVRDFLRRLAGAYPHIKVILAHFGRYVDPRQFLEFMDTDVMDLPSFWLEMSSVTCVDVYKKFLARRDLWPRLLFGSDMPWAMLDGHEVWDDKTAPGMFLTKRNYEWSDKALQEKHAARRRRLTFNTYHVLKCFKQAVAECRIAPEEEKNLKRNVFFKNVRKLFA